MARPRAELLESRRLLDATTGVFDDFFATTTDTPLDVGLVNGAFETGDLGGWNDFTTTGGTLGGAGFPAAVRFDTNNDGNLSPAVQFLVGNGGGGVLQNVQLAPGDVVIQANIAVSSLESVTNAGVFELLFDGTVIDRHDFGAIAGGVSDHAALSATLVGTPTGTYEIGVRVTRSGDSVFGSSPFSYVDDVLVFGTATGVSVNDVAAVDHFETRLVVPPEHGVLEFRPDGSLGYVPAPEFSGVDDFRYKMVQPGEGLTLFTIDTVNDLLLTLDSASGELAVVASINRDMVEVDMTYYNGAIYAINVDGSTFELVTIDPSSGSVLSATPLTSGESTITAAKGITVVGGTFFVIFGKAAGYCGNACGRAHILGRLDPTTGELTELVNYRSISGGFNFDFHALSTDVDGQIIANRLAGEAIQAYVLEYDPPSLISLGQHFPGHAGISDTSFAGGDLYMLNPTDAGRVLYRFDTDDEGYTATVDRVRLGLISPNLRGLAYAPDLETATATVSISVNAPGSLASQNDIYSTNQDVAIAPDDASGTLANDTRAGSGPFTAILVDEPRNGHLELATGGGFTYTPNAGFLGTDFFTYLVDNGTSQSNISSVTIFVEPLNYAPVAVADTYATIAGLPFHSDSLGVMENDFDADSDPLTASVVTTPSNGDLSLAPDGTFTYTPELSFRGIDVFTYQISDGNNSSNVTTATIYVGGYEAIVLSDKPVAYWRLGEASGSPTAVDASGHGRDGTFVGGITLGHQGSTAIDPDTSVRFDGDNGTLIEVAPHSSLNSFTNSFSIEAWIKPESLIGNSGAIVDTRALAGDAGGYGFSTNDGGLWFEAWGVGEYITIASPLVQNQWQHVAVVFDANNDAHFYYNGQFLETIAGNSPIDPNGQPLYIGRAVTEWSDYREFLGGLDEIAIYDRELTPDEIASHVQFAMPLPGTVVNTNDDGPGSLRQAILDTNANPGPDTITFRISPTIWTDSTAYENEILADEPLAYWRFNEESGTTVADALGNFPGTLNGGVSLGAAAATPVLGNAAVFDGVNDFVSTGQMLLSGLSQFTISQWVRPAAFAGARAGVIGQNNDIELGFVSPTAFQVWTPNGGYLTTPYDFPRDEWHHVVALGDGQQLRMYYDGVLVGTGGTPTSDYGSIHDSTVNIGGGGIFNEFGNWFTGAIDEVAIFDTALNAARIRTHYEAALGLPVIRPLSELPSLNDHTGGTTIDGRSQSAIRDTNPFGPEIVLDGSRAGDSNGLTILSDGNRLIGLNIRGFHEAAVQIIGGRDNWLAGNYIGTNATGTVAVANIVGISIFGGAQENIVGTNGDDIDDTSERNIISGNTLIGVILAHPTTANNIVAGNFIGTDATGTTTFETTDTGLLIFDGAYSNVIGTDGDGTADTNERNIISGHMGSGVWIEGTDTQWNVVAGNFIGTDVTGTHNLGNGWRGVEITGGPRANRIGTDGNGVADSSERNIISGNALEGVLIFHHGTDGNVVAGNYIGTDVSGSLDIGNGTVGIGIGAGASSNQIGSSGDGFDPNGANEANTIAFNLAGVVVIDDSSTGNSIRRNSIWANRDLGIDLGGDGVTPNDSGDADVGPNTRQNFPVFAWAQAGTSTRVIGSLNSLPDTSYTLDFYANSAAYGSGFRTGETWLDSHSVTTDASGHAQFDVFLSVTTTADKWLTATATDPYGNTSEFSRSQANIDNADGIDSLYAAIGDGDLSSDLTGDGVVDQQDLDFLVHNVIGTEFGDVNLDRKIDIEDFGFVFGNFRHENVGWAGGDINGDNIVDIEDFGFVFGNFGFGTTSPSLPASEARLTGNGLIARHELHERGQNLSEVSPEQPRQVLAAQARQVELPATSTADQTSELRIDIAESKAATRRKASDRVFGSLTLDDELSLSFDNLE